MKTFRTGFSLVVIVVSAHGLWGQEASLAQAPSAADGADAAFGTLRDAYLAKYKPLKLQSEQAWWDANTTGSDEAFRRREQVEKALVELHSDKELFTRLKELKESGQVRDGRLSRELDVMYRTFLPGQGDRELQKRIVALETEIEQIFNSHRSEVDGKTLTENDVRQILSESADSALAEKAWKAYMQVGAKVEQKLHEVVKLRNELARQLGFRNFYVMRLALSEIDEGELLTLFDELDQRTREPFAALKKEIDANMAKRFGLREAELRPWHFGDLFFQEAPPLGGSRLDAVYQDKDLLALTRLYYDGLGLQTADIIERSDLYEKPGKNPHAFAIDMDRAGDVRVLCNLKPNLYWMDTMLHELGHAVYDKYIRPDVPFLLREPAHSLITEGYAMMMGSMCKNPEFLSRALQLSAGQTEELVRSARRALRAEKLIFSRWAQVMVRFEQGMYAEPQQDLGKLWWTLKQRYQSLNAPSTVSRPDYAAKIHVVSAPAYYHSYMMGDLFACQLHQYLAVDVLGSSDPLETCFYGRKEAGDFLREKIFGPGNLYPWKELVRQATGESLSAKYFVQQYVQN